MIGFGRTARNIGGRASGTAMTKAEGTAMGTRKTRVVKSDGRGSSAGLNAQKSTWLEPSGRGYSNPQLQSKDIKGYGNFSPNVKEESIFSVSRPQNYSRDLTDKKGVR
jgi:hypothetical protein